MSGTPHGVCVVLIALLALVISACTDAHGSATVPSSAATPAPKVKVGVDEHIPLRAWWKVAGVTGSAPP